MTYSVWEIPAAPSMNELWNCISFGKKVRVRSPWGFPCCCASVGISGTVRRHMTSALFGYVNQVHISIVYPGDNYIHRQNVALCDLSVISALRSDFTHDGSYGNRGVGKASTLGARPHSQWVTSVTIQYNLNHEKINNSDLLTTHITTQHVISLLSHLL